MQTGGLMRSDLLAQAAVLVATFSLVYTSTPRPSSLRHAVRELQASREALEREVLALRAAAAGGEQASAGGSRASPPAPESAVIEAEARAVSAPPPVALGALEEQAPALPEPEVPRSFHLATARRDETLDRLAGLDELLELAREGDGRALGTLLGALNDDDARVREDALVLAGKLDSPDLVRHIEPLLKDPSPAVRMQLVAELVGMPDGGPLLLAMLSDEDPDVVEAAIDALGALRYDPARPWIASLVYSQSPEITTAAGIALRRFGDEERAQIAVDRVAAGARSAGPDERRVALQQIRKIGGEAALAYLEGGLGDGDPGVRREVEQGLAPPKR